MGVGVRRRGRWCALQVLYGLDVNKGTSSAQALLHYRDSFDTEPDPRSESFATGLVNGTLERLAEIDDIIQSASRNWRLDRMSCVDRNILRLATYELGYAPEVPTKVVINEAVELAKRYGTGEAPAFVNGILVRIAQGLRLA